MSNIDDALSKLAANITDDAKEDILSSITESRHSEINILADTANLIERLIKLRADDSIDDSELMSLVNARKHELDQLAQRSDINSRVKINKVGTKLLDNVLLCFGGPHGGGGGLED